MCIYTCEIYVVYIILIYVFIFPDPSFGTIFKINANPHLINMYTQKNNTITKTFRS